MTFLTPRGLSVSTPGPVILDAEGKLIWMEQKWGMSTDLQVQLYQGNAYLTFWAGIDKVSLGNGSYYMVSSHSSSSLVTACDSLHCSWTRLTKFFGSYPQLVMICLATFTSSD